MYMKEMTPNEFDVFRKKTTAQRAQYHEVEVGLSSSEALFKAEEEFFKLCPQGMQTPEHFFHNLVLEDGVVAGYIWFAIRQRLNSKKVFINDIMVDEQFRGQDFGKFMMSWLEGKTRQLGLVEIALHVLGNNMAARGLYEKMGYSITNLDMSKKLD